MIRRQLVLPVQSWVASLSASRSAARGGTRRAAGAAASWLAEEHGADDHHGETAVEVVRIEGAQALGSRGATVHDQPAATTQERGLDQILG